MKTLQSLHPSVQLSNVLARFGDRLPQDIVDDAARRLRSLCVFMAGLTLFFETLTRWRGAGIVAPSGLPKTIGFIVFWVATVTVYVIARRRSVSNERLLDLGGVYEVVIAFSLAVQLNVLAWPDVPVVGSWPIGAVWVLIFPVLVPNAPLRTLVASLGAAVMDPLVLFWYINRARIELPDAAVLSVHYWPYVVALLVAPILARIAYIVGGKLQEARALGSYHLVKRLGQGGMGEVWLGEHKLLARPAAVKLISPELLEYASPDGAATATKRFEREARATAALCSPHTIKVFDFGVARDGTFYYVMELLDGVDLNTLVALDGPQPAERVAYVVEQVCHSLEEAHQNGMVHRDIKPANIVVCRYGMDLDFVKVLDFGLVKHKETTDVGDSGLTQAGSISGTPAYLAPEMAMADETVDHRADLYCLGCVAYWMLTGKQVFEAATPMALVIAQARDEPVPPSERVDIEVPEALERVIMTCLNKDPADRPVSAAELGQLVRAVGITDRWTAERRQAWWDDRRPRRRPTQDPHDEPMESTVELEV